MTTAPQLLLPLGPPVRIALIEEAPAPYGPTITCASDVWNALLPGVRQWDRERFMTVILNGAHQPIGFDTVSVGTLTTCHVHPREVMKALILANAAAFIAVHNHPSGDLTPSNADKEVTQTLKKAGQLLGIKLLDHVIVGQTGYYSFNEADQL